MGQAGPKGERGPPGPPGHPGPPGEVIQPLPLQTPHKNKRSIDASQPLWSSAAEDVGRGPSSPTGTPRPTRVGLAELLLSVGRDVEALRRPTGTKENPARSCRDLRLSQPHIRDGPFWVDPNQGCSRDAIRVHCRFSGGGAATCLPPHNDTEASPPSSALPTVQLRFLRLLSAAAAQSVSGRCPPGGATAPLRLIAANGERLEPRSAHLTVTASRPCGASGSDWLQELRSPRPELFPLRSAEGAADFGPVCFIA